MNFGTAILVGVVGCAAPEPPPPEANTAADQLITVDLDGSGTDILVRWNAGVLTWPGGRQEIDGRLITFDVGRLDEDKEAVAAAEYKNKLMTITTQTKVSELTNIFNDLHGFRIELSGSPREINDTRYCMDIVDRVSDLSDEYLNEARYNLDKLVGGEKYVPDSEKRYASSRMSRT